MERKNFPNKRSIFKEILHFVVHLRWHYQLFILSGGYLLGGLLSSEMQWSHFGIQFINVHLLLFGGATAYNSYWDKDEGPVGGLQNPPQMSRWMWAGSLLVQATGFTLALLHSWLFTFIYLISMILFWIYSTPHFRWKGAALKSLIAIGVSTGLNSALMGYLAAGNAALPATVWSAAFGVMLMILSLYPVSQLYQLDEDMRRGDQTFAMQFGFAGVMQFFAVTFTGGVILVGLSLLEVNSWLGFIFWVIGTVVGLWVFRQMKNLTLEQDDYQTVMRIKYRTSLAFVAFLLLILLLRHSAFGIL